MSKEISNIPSNPIVFFDGVCGLCNSFVYFLIKIDKTKVLRYAPLQGSTAMQSLPKEYIEELSTFVFKKNDKIFNKSNAVIELLKTLGGFWYLSAILLIFPLFIRDLVYDFVAKNRIKWFGEKESCRMPTVTERELFLD
jgi:predicted DCC family thiol-disulfide oxidoreductase YuxK